MESSGTQPLAVRRELAKAMTFKNYLGLGIGAIIGVGWVVVAGDWLVRGGPLGAILGFLIGGLLLVFVGLCYAELTPALPVAGGELAFSFKAFGTGPSFLTGWFLSLAYIIMCPFESVAVGWLIEFLLPSLKSKALYSVAGTPVSLLSMITGVALTLIIVYLNYRGAKATARFQTICTVGIVFCAAAFVLIALIKGSFSNLSPLFAGGGGAGAAFGSIVAVMGIVPWFMSGFDTIPQGAEESGASLNPKDLGRAVIIAILASSVFYSLVILALSLSMPWQESIKFEMPTATAFQAAFGYTWATKLVILSAFLGLITSLNAFFIAATRLLFAMGRGGLISTWLGEVHETHQVPKNAILMLGLITVIGPFIGKSSILPIVNVGSLAFVSGWFVTCLSSVRLRKTAPQMKRPYKVKKKIALYLGTIISGLLIILLVFPGSSAQLKWPMEYFIFVGWLLVGYFAYRLRQAKKDMTPEERAYQILGEYQ
jgi:APA family basic amino acid/polyamine antiporter